MPTTQQIGHYVMGTHGYPIDAELDPLVTDIFSDVSAVTMKLYRPDGTFYDDRVLPVPDCITDVNGKLRFITLPTDLVIDGKYTVYFVVAKNDNSELVFGGDFTVSEQ